MEKLDNVIYSNFKKRKLVSEEVEHREQLGLQELFEKIKTTESTELTSKTISSIQKALEPYSLQELIKFIQDNPAATIRDNKIAFSKAVKREIKRKFSQISKNE